MTLTLSEGAETARGSGVAHTAYPEADLLRRITSLDRPILHERTLVVLAHPDDETLACGALLPRLPDLTIVHVTDGAPLGGDHARDAGFASPNAYAAERRRELGAALHAGGVAGARLLCLDVPDQEVARSIEPVARRLAPLLADADLVLTHQPEGGHPDHDATAIAVGAAARLVAAERGSAPVLVTMPLYRAGPNGSWLRQSFADPAGASTLRLTSAERAHKEAMLAAHRTQHDTLHSFGAADEPYRVVGPEILTRPPAGPTLYDGFGWGITGTDVARQARAALGALGLDVQP